ncbi:hypothetical protein AAZV13_17G211100 [Glycine max]
MQAVGRLGSFISRGVNTVSGTFLPFGGAVDIVVVQQKDGSFKSSPWYVRFGKYHKVFKEEEKEKIEVHVSVNGVEPDFNMYLNRNGEAIFLHHADTQEEEEEEEEEEESTLFGGESETDDITSPSGRRHFKSKSWNFDSPDKSNSDAKVVVGRTKSRRARILGLVSRSLRGEGGDGDVNGVDLRERAEIAAKLLELKWSTNLNFDHKLPCRDRKKTRGDALDNGLPLPPRKMKEEARSCSDQDGISSKPVFNEMLCPASAGCGDVRVHAQEVLHAATLMLPELASLNLKEGRNTITFSFPTVKGKQQVDAHMYLWKWNTRIVISDVDGTITRSDVLGQFMPLVGIDWSQTGVAHLFSDIKLLFLSARAISQAYHTRQFLCNLKQDGKLLPDGPVVISPDGLFPSLYREVIRRAPHEFKIACLEDIKALFPPDWNPFYAGFGNRDTDEVSYLKVGIPKGKIFIINPRGEIAVNRRCFDTKSYTSLHSLVNGMFPPTNSSEQEDFNSWNYWKLPETSSATNI